MAADGRGSAEGGEIEGDRDLSTFGRCDLDNGGIGGEGVCGEIKFESGPGQGAWATAATIVVCMAARGGRRDGLLAVIDVDLEVPPEVMGAEHESRGRV